MEENVMIVPDEEIGVDELEENLTGEVEQQQAEENDELVAALRQGLGELFEDGWTTGELDAMNAGRKREAGDRERARRCARGLRVLEAHAGDGGGAKGERADCAGRRRRARCGRAAPSSR